MYVYVCIYVCISIYAFIQIHIYVYIITSYIYIFIIHTVKCGGTIIKNKGYVYEELDINEVNNTEIQKMRGYKIIKLQELDISCPPPTHPVPGSNPDKNKFICCNNHRLIPVDVYDDNDDDISDVVKNDCFCNII
jgi:hypothetical protein